MKSEVYEKYGEVSVVIGDDMYLEAIANAEDVKRYEELVVMVPKRNSNLSVRFVDREDMPTAIISLSQVEKPRIIMSDDMSKWYHEESLTVLQKTLGCDTASYSINGYPVNTMADGEYGEMFYDPPLRNVMIVIDGGWMAESYADFKRTVMAALGLDEKDKVAG